MFATSLAANAAYDISLLVMSREPSYLVRRVPFLLATLTCGCCDAAVIIQIFYYGKGARASGGELATECVDEQEQDTHALKYSPLDQCAPSE